MSKVIDYAWTQFRGADLKARGYVGAMRYISHDGSKDLSAHERDDLRANGLDIGLVFESTSGRATQGSAAGVADANFANDRADSLGYVGTLWYAVDFDGSPAQVQAYFDGVASVCRRLSAPYGSNKIIDGVRYPGVGWQTAAWSNRQVSARAGILQNGFAGDHDDNTVLKADYGQWTSHTAPTSKPAQENDMPTVRIPEPDYDSPRAPDGRPYEKATVATVPGSTGLIQVSADGWPEAAPVVRVAIGSGRPDGQFRSKHPDAGIHDNVPVANWPANWGYDHTTPFGQGFDEQASVVNYGPGDVTLTAVAAKA